MVAPVGNSFWKARSSHGRGKIFERPEDLEAACNEYFQWVEDNPLIEMKAFAYQGVITQEPVAKMRAMTLNGLCLFLGISDETWFDYRKRQDFIGVTSLCEKYIYEQKFTGAAADLLNANIIARDLGLADKGALDVRTPDGIQVQSAQISNEELEDRLRELGLGSSALQLAGKIADK